METRNRIQELIDLKHWFRRTSGNLPAALNWEECNAIVELIDDAISRNNPYCTVCRSPIGRNIHFENSHVYDVKNQIIPFIENQQGVDPRVIIMMDGKIMGSFRTDYCMACGRKL